MRTDISKGLARGTALASQIILLVFLLLVPFLSASAQNYPSGFTAAGLTLNGGASINGTRLRLTDGKSNEARSAFFTTKVNVQAFTNDFSFQLTSATADGFTFTIQGDNSNALGAAGGALGYGPNSKNTIPGIGNSLAVGFQLYSTVLGNKKVSLTGDWTEGASPAATPGTNTTSINLHSGDVMNLHMTYDGTTLTWTITDSVTKKSFSKSLSINIPALTGQTAYVGFTAGTGGLTAIQDILTWTYTSNSTAPSITTQPANQMVLAGQPATFSVVAAGTAPLTYQWMANTGAGFNNISGAISSSYMTPPAMSTDDGTAFQVVVTNAEGSVTSNAATLTVNTPVPPAITTEPVSQTVIEGQTATFAVVASGTAPLTYQWMANTGSGYNNISNATSSSYSTPPTVMSTDNGTLFEVIVTNAQGSATSNPVMLTVNPAPPAITTQPANQVVLVGQAATFSVVATGTAPLTYQWMDNTGSGFNIIPSATSSSYTTPPAMGTDTGTAFEVMVTNAQGSATSSAAILSVTSPVLPSINIQPANQSVTVGQSATFSVVAGGTPPLTYQWMENTGSGFNNIGANSSTYTTPPTMTTDSGAIFEVAVTNAQGSVTSNPATLTVNTPTNHYVYVVTPGPVITVYDMDNSFAQVKQIVAGTSTESIRGSVASAVGNFLYISYGCTTSTACTPYLMKYDLLADTVVWNEILSNGIDSFSITPDGATIYMPSGEADRTHSLWYILNSSDGSVTGTMDSGVTGPHNTIVSNSGAHPDANGDGLGYLVVAQTSDGSIIQRIGPVLNDGDTGIRPFTINAQEQYAFIIPWGLNGFQVGSITTGSILFTVKVTGFSSSICFWYDTCSHGISLSPDGSELYVVDYYNNYVHVFNVTGLPSSAPVQVANIKLVHPYASTGPWLTHSRDGKFVFVAYSGDVIETSTRQVIGYMPALNQTPVDIEIDFQNGVVSFTPLSRAGVGYAP